jgi:hypothetical protein
LGTVFSSYSKWNLTRTLSFWRETICNQKVTRRGTRNLNHSEIFTDDEISKLCCSEGDVQEWGNCWLRDKWVVMRGLGLPEIRERRDVTCLERSLSQYQ